eukprot:SAG22_NODE_5811_length_948_cov_4.224971_1_plen_130_part_10
MPSFGRPMSLAEAEAMILEADRDNDGCVDWDDFQHIVGRVDKAVRARVHGALAAATDGHGHSHGHGHGHGAGELSGSNRDRRAEAEGGIDAMRQPRPPSYVTAADFGAGGHSGAGSKCGFCCRREDRNGS